jgi:hypothetical protein
VLNNVTLNIPIPLFFINLLLGVDRNLSTGFHHASSVMIWREGVKLGQVRKGKEKV